MKSFNTDPIDFFNDLTKLIENDSILLSFSDTVPGLFCSPFSQICINRIRRMKNRSHKKGFLILKGDPSDIGETSPVHQAYIDRFWPGPLTIILNLKDKRLSSISPDSNTIGIRSPSHPFWMQFLKYSNISVLSTSANEYETIFYDIACKINDPQYLSMIFRKCTLLDTNYYLIKFNNGIDYLLLSDNCAIKQKHQTPSTIIKIDGGILNIIREGAISRESLMIFHNSIEI